MSGPRYAIDRADCLAWLGGLPDESVDLILTDPAYESLEKHRAIGTTTRLTKAWFPIFPNARMGELLREFYRVLRRGRHCYLLVDAETMFLLRPLAIEAGFTFWDPLVWDKVKIGMGYHYRRRKEFVLFLEKSSERITRQLMDLSIPDVLAFPALRGSDFYPTEKPVPLLRLLIDQSTRPGELVMDCFAGSGATGQAALEAGLDFIGCDVAETSNERMHRRLGAIQGASPTTREALARGQSTLFGRAHA